MMKHIKLQRRQRKKRQLRPFDLLRKNRYLSCPPLRTQAGCETAQLYRPALLRKLFPRKQAHSPAARHNQLK